MTAWSDLIEHIQYREAGIKRLEEGMPCTSDYLQGKYDMCEEILLWMDKRELRNNVC